MAVLVDVLWAGKANSYLECVSVPVTVNPAPSVMKCCDVINMPPSIWLSPLGNGIISGAQCWSLLLAD